MVDVLAANGVDTVLGVPGGAISSIYDALVGRSEFRVVHVRHETSALFMAVGQVRMRPQTLPVVLVTSGPGVTNAVTGLAAALGEGTPVVLIGGEVPRSKFGRSALQEGSGEAIDVLHIVRSVCRSAELVSIPGRAPFQLQAAIDRARALRGPVFLSLPLDVAVASASPMPPVIGRRIEHSAPDEHAIREAATELRNAKRPLIVVGSGARGAAASIRNLAQRLNIPVVTSPKAKGIVSENAAYCLGVFGYGGHPSATEWLRSEAPDVVLALGCGLSEPSTNSWSSLLQATRTMIQVDLDPAQFGRNYRTDVAILADCAEVVPLLDELLVDCRPWRHRLNGVSYIEPEAMTTDRALLSPARVIRVLQETLPSDTVYTSDIGEHLLFALHYVRVNRPDQFAASLSLGSMGSGIGAAIGAKLAAPERPVVSISGDYGFQMFGMELSTCVQEGLGVIFVVMNDARMRMVEAGIERIYGRGLAMHGPMIDFGALASAHGARGFVVHDASELRAALSQATSNVPTVIDVRVDPDSAFPMNARVQEISNFMTK